MILGIETPFQRRIWMTTAIRMSARIGMSRPFLFCAYYRQSVDASVDLPCHFQNYRLVKDIQGSLGQRIRELRIKQGFDSQDAFSEYLGLHRTVVGFWETGRKDLRLSTLVRVAEGLGVTLSELFAGLESGERSAVPKPRSLDRGRILRDIAVLEEHVHKLKADVLSGGSQKPAQSGKTTKNRLSPGPKKV
jgi:transcriptional regulator with XRE-family HTH domain